MRFAQRAVRLGAAVCVALVLAACTTTPKSKTAPAPAPSDALAPKAFFWEVQAPEGGARLFLLGSVHIGDGRQLVLDARIEEDWALAQELVVELDTSSLSPIDAVDATNRFGLLPRGTTLRSVVAPETYKRVAAYMKERNYAMERIDRMRPWLVAQVVTQLEYAAAGLDAENGVDMALLRRAAGRKGIVALETLDEQAALFAGLPAGLQETMLLEILREAQALLAVTRATLDAWELGDEAMLSSLLFGNSQGDVALGEFYERVFYNRNRLMADRLVALTADGRPRFVVVGTGHLIGAQGIPELLAQRGFRVERVGSARVVPGAGKTKPEAIAPPSATPTPAPAPAPVAPTQPSVPAPAGAPSEKPAPALPAPLVPAPTPAPAPAVPMPALVPVPEATPVVPAQSPPGVAPSAPRVPSSDVHDAWLGQDAGPAPGQEQPPMQRIPAPAPAPVVAPAPVPVETPAPAADPAAKRKKPRFSR